MSNKIIHLEVQGPVAVMRIKRDPVNSMNLDMWEQLQEALTTCEKDPKIRAVIITSGLQTAEGKNPIFTAGNDLNELYSKNTTKERYIKFWTVSNVFLANLYKSPLLTVAAIDGYCPAGGTCLAMCCDYRIATENVVMGLNEVRLGISVPYIWTKLMATLIGFGKMEKLCQFSQMVNAKQAVQIGLIDTVIPNVTTLLSTSQTLLKGLLKLPDAGRHICKLQARQGLAGEWGDIKRVTREAEEGWKFLVLPQVTGALAAVMKGLGGGKEKGKL